MKKINVAELLRNCPNGMELDCTMYENTSFLELSENESDEYPIIVRVCDKYIIHLTKEGCWVSRPDAKCIIFPKGKTTWEGFVPPCQFKDGDVVISSLGNIHILKNRSTSYIYVDFAHNGKGSLCKSLTTCVNAIRLATEEEKAKLFQAIKDNGYKWNVENRTLEKLPKFKVGDRIKLNNCSSIYTITDLLEDKYRATVHSYDLYEIEFERQDAYKLVPNKFDINTLVPFDSRVLVRHNRDNKWCGSFFSHIDNDFHSHCYKFVTTSGKSYPMCIPYEGNEHLLGKTDDCDEYFNTWEQ